MQTDATAFLYGSRSVCCYIVPTAVSGGMEIKMRKIQYREALNEAMCEEMQRDSSVIIMGEDVGLYGGGFLVTDGLIEKFGEKRVLDTPVSETAFVGTAVGAAITGMRPVVELMFSDFMAVCWDQIMNEAAKMHFLYDRKVPMVIRTAAGGGTGASAQHSQSLENMYAHVPGLKVVVPSTAYDAKGLLKSAIRDNNPVIVLEQKLLYKTEGEVPEEEYTVPIGKAAVRRAGSDVTIISYGRIMNDCLKAAEQLETEGISAELIDLRTISPLDKETVLSSVRKTGRAVIAHEAVTFGGFGGELAAIIAEEAFDALKAPIKRVGAAYCPIPCGAAEEQNVFPDAGRIAEAARSVAGSRN